jgi:hypothetical protein
MTQQFENAKAFTKFITTERMSRKGVKGLNEMPDFSRISRLVQDIYRWAGWSIEDGGLEFPYREAADGFQWVIDSGRLNGQTVMAIRAMTVADLCSIIHDLRTQCANRGEFASYLMARFS